MDSTPKLSLSKLPCKPRELLEMQTPPLQSSVSIPFHWEEAPGKPRITTIPSPNNKTACRCLELPPRLLNDAANITNIPSPTTVLDGPYMGQSLSRTFSFSFRKVSHTSQQEERSKKRGNDGTERSSFDSWRWGSLGEDTKVARDSFDFSFSVNDACKSDTSVKMTRIKRRFIFLSFSGKNSIWVRVKNLFHSRN
ncbi:hypothetical protein Adt_01252 [Abeliophyllum distichum]|uniref:Uncharacterized protein n=1 Tax=Abeliophyllum distichum TaxID=126358 RepID=A0ABD1VSD4_9LAMI